MSITLYHENVITFTLLGAKWGEITKSEDYRLIIFAFSEIKSVGSSIGVEKARMVRAVSGVIRIRHSKRLRDVPRLRGRR